MKKLAVAIMGLTISSAAMAEPHIQAFCYEQIKGQPAATGTMGLYNGKMTSGVLELQSSLVTNNLYKLQVYKKHEHPHHKRHLQRYVVKANSEASFPLPIQEESCGSGSTTAPVDQVPLKGQVAQVSTPAAAPIFLRMPTQCEAVPEAVIEALTGKYAESPAQVGNPAQVPVAPVGQVEAPKGQIAEAPKGQLAEAPVFGKGAQVEEEICTKTSACHDEVKVRLISHHHINHHDKISLKKDQTKTVTITHRQPVGDSHEHVTVKCDVTYLGEDL